MSFIKLPNSNEFHKIRYVLVLFSFLLIVLFVKYFYKSSQEKMYDEIVANSFEANVDFKIYIEKFYRDCEFYGLFPRRPDTIIIRFSKLDQLVKTTHIHGLSLGYNEDSKIEIYINPSSWNRFSKSSRYFLMYHELAHDVLNLDDLDNLPINEGKLMYPELSSFNNKNMDDFIECYHKLFDEISKN